MNYSAKLFVRKDQKTSNGGFMIYLRMIIFRVKHDYSTGVSVPDPSLFIDEKQQIKGVKFTKENTLLYMYKSKADQIIFDHQLSGKTLTFDIFNQLYKSKKENNNSFYEFALEEINLMEGTVSAGHLRQLRCEISKLKKYKKSLNFDEITLQFIQKYEQYMRVELKNKTNSVGKSMKKIKMLVGKAIKKELISKNPFDNYKIKQEPSNRIFLSIDEVNFLQGVYNSNCLKLHHQNVLKLFLFSCYTGLRYSDLLTFKVSDIECSGNDNIINLVMDKTKESVRIPLTEKAMELIALKKDPLFKIYTGQVSNRFLKEIIKNAGINKNISFHCARHTFATIALTIGIPLEVVSKLLGHTDLRTTQIYAKVIDTLKIEQMKKFNLI